MTGVDAGADGWIAGLVNALPEESMRLSTSVVLLLGIYKNGGTAQPLCCAALRSTFTTAILLRPL